MLYQAAMAYLDAEATGTKADMLKAESEVRALCRLHGQNFDRYMQGARALRKHSEETARKIA